MLASCSSQLKYEPREGESGSSRESIKPVSNASSACRSPYVVKSGDTLSGIAYDCKVDMDDIARINDLLPPYIIYINQELSLPYQSSVSTQDEVKSAPTVSEKEVKSEVVPEKKTTPQIKENKSELKSKPQPVADEKINVAAAPKTSSKDVTAKAIERTKKTSSSKSSRWQWPMHNGLDYRYRRDKAGLSVLEIYGIPGQKIRAVAPGKVVYSGNGIANYGWMLVIKHDNDYMSIYAHNSSLLVQEGDEVKAGQEIALLGATGATDRPKLYLEARYQGRKIDINKKLKRK